MVFTFPSVSARGPAHSCFDCFEKPMVRGILGAMATAVRPHVIVRAEARAKVDPDFADLLATLVDAPTGAAGDYTRDAAHQLNDRRSRDALEEFKAGALPTAAVQGLLGFGTPQAVHQLRSRGRIIGMPLGNGTWFPAWQFAGGQLRADLGRVLELLGRFTTDVIAADRAMRLIRDDLDGRSIADALDRPDLAPAAWAALADLGS
jgi:hypothetical protein